jgi:hypothetical protein
MHAHLFIVVGFCADWVWAVVFFVGFGLSIGFDFVDVGLTGGFRSRWFLRLGGVLGGLGRLGRLFLRRLGSLGLERDLGRLLLLGVEIRRKRRRVLLLGRLLLLGGLARVRLLCRILHYLNYNLKFYNVNRFMMQVT